MKGNVGLYIPKLSRDKNLDFCMLLKLLSLANVISQVVSGDRQKGAGPATFHIFLRRNIWKF